MINLNDAIHYKLNKLSDMIVNCKKAACATPLIVKTKVDVSDDECKNVVMKTCEERTTHISRAHPAWGLYKALKRQTSLWFMVVQLVKHPGINPLTDIELARKLSNHGSKALFKKAIQMHKELCCKADKGWVPTGFGVWLIQRDKAVAEFRRRQATQETVLAEAVA
jgi:hypothetical protein